MALNSDEILLQWVHFTSSGNKADGFSRRIDDYALLEAVERISEAVSLDPFDGDFNSGAFPYNLYSLF